MSLSEDIYQKIPEELKESEDFMKLRDILRINAIEKKEQLIDHLQKQSEEITAWLKENQSTGISTIQLMTTKIAKLDRYKKWLKWCEDYL